MAMIAAYRQVYDPIGNSLGLSSIVAALPLLVLFVLLGVLRMRAWLASVIGLAVALIIAVAVYSMPVSAALDSGLLGAAFGFFPIMWIVINAIWVYNLTVETGHFDVLRRSFASISDDQRIQAIIIAFCFGALMEALAGFGTPVAISSVMLIALGFRPLKAATVALVANTAPVAFGALAVPITTLAAVTGLPVGDLGAMVGRQTPVLAIFVPLALVFIVDGRRPTSGRSRSRTSSPRSLRRWPSWPAPASGIRRKATSRRTAMSSRGPAPRGRPAVPMTLARRTRPGSPRNRTPLPATRPPMSSGPTRRT
jgi:lactate permease